MDDLRRLAEAATPGPWERLAGDEGRRIASEPVRVIFGGDTAVIARVESPLGVHHANAAYIAACSPDRILALLDRLAAAESQREALDVDLLGKALWNLDEAGLDWIEDRRSSQEFAEIIARAYRAQQEVKALAALKEQPR